MSLLLKLASMACISVTYYIIGYSACGVFPTCHYTIGFLAGIMSFGTYAVINAVIGD